MRARRLLVGLALCAGGCGGASPLFPEDYAASYREVRSCRPSGDHNLNQVRVLADPLAAGTYLSRDGGFGPGRIILKVEYEFGDDRCSGPVKRFTVMQRVADGGAARALDWRWQTVDGRRAVVDSDDSRCIGCHKSCGVPPDGFEATCGLP